MRLIVLNHIVNVSNTTAAYSKVRERQRRKILQRGCMSDRYKCHPADSRRKALHVSKEADDAIRSGEKLIRFETLVITIPTESTCSCQRCQCCSLTSTFQVGRVGAVLAFRVKREIAVKGFNQCAVSIFSPLLGDRKSVSASMIVRATVVKGYSLYVFIRRRQRQL